MWKRWITVLTFLLPATLSFAQLTPVSNVVFQGGIKPGYTDVTNYPGMIRWSETNLIHEGWNGSTWAPIAGSGVGSYTLHTTHGSLNIAATGFVYYFDFRSELAAAAFTDEERGFKVPYSGRIVGLTIVPRVGTTVGVNQSGTVDFYLRNKDNGGSTAYLASSQPDSLTGEFEGPTVHTGLNVPITAGVHYVMQMNTPSFSVAPRAVRHDVILFISQD